MKWKKVPGYRVEVTKDGKYVRNSITKKIKKQYVRKDGYIQVWLLTDNYKRTTKRIHQLVALTYIGPYPSKTHEVNHKDLNKSNCHYKNLEYVTQSENTLHAVRNGAFRNNLGDNLGNRKGENNGRAKLTEEQVIDIRFLYNTGLYYYKDLGKLFHVTEGMVGHIINKRSWVYE